MKILNSKSFALLSCLGLALILWPNATNADKPSVGGQQGRTMKWGGPQGHSYSAGNSVSRSRSVGGSVAGSNRGGRGYSNRSYSNRSYSNRGYSNRGRGPNRYYGYPGNRNLSYFNVTPYGVNYGRLGGGPWGGNSFQLNVPLYRGYSNFGTYGFGGGGFGGGGFGGATYYRSGNVIPYPYPGYGTYGRTTVPYYRDPGYYGSLAEQGVRPVYPSSRQPLTERSTLKPPVDLGQQRFSSNQMTIIATNDLAEPTQRRAEQAFRSGQYSDSARLANEALMIDPNNGLLALFSAQANFAAGYFDQAHNEIDTATKALPIDQWKYVVSNFRQFYGKDDYVNQVDRLSRHIDANPTDDKAIALRGYHYGGLGYPEAADKDFLRALQLNPSNVVAQKLASVFGSSAPIQIQPSVNQPVPQQNSVLEAGPEALPVINGSVEPAPGYVPAEIPYDSGGLEIIGPDGQ